MLFKTALKCPFEGLYLQKKIVGEVPDHQMRIF